MFTMLFQHFLALRFRAGAALPQCRIAQHLPDGHPGRLQSAEKFDPAQDGCIVVALT